MPLHLLESEDIMDNKKEMVETTATERPTNYTETACDDLSLIECNVTMDGRRVSSSDFVAVITKDTGDTAIMYNTDALTLGMAVKMVTMAFVRSMYECSPEERQQITEILGDAFVSEQPLDYENVQAEGVPGDIPTDLPSGDPTSEAEPIIPEVVDE